MVPQDGIPRQFAVSADVVDAWTRATGQRIGSVFLSRSPDDSADTVTAFTATCPHLGCAVDFDPAAGLFECPCHESAFALDGKKISGPSLRGLDPLHVEVVEIDGVPEIWVDFQRFRTGVAERIAVG
jgi:Rieske Fe-S protein